MLGLVDYSSGSDDESPGRAQGPGEQPAAAAGGAQAAAAAGQTQRQRAPQQQQAPKPSGLPSAAELLGGGGGGGLPPPDFGAPGGSGGTAGAKRQQPDTRGPLPNPLALDSKLPRRCVREQAGGWGEFMAVWLLSSEQVLQG